MGGLEFEANMTKFRNFELHCNSCSPVILPIQVTLPSSWTVAWFPMAVPLTTSLSLQVFFRLLISNLQAVKVGTQEEATLSLFNLRVPDSKGNTSPMCMIYL
jgi:hypothetical protein